MKILFLDESGDHNLNAIDENYPLFVLAGCILDRAYHDEELTRRMRDFKTKLFGQDKIVLHYVDYTRNKNGFEEIKEKRNPPDVVDKGFGIFDLHKKYLDGIYSRYLICNCCRLRDLSKTSGYFLLDISGYFIIKRNCNVSRKTSALFFYRH